MTKSLVRLRLHLYNTTQIIEGGELMSAKFWGEVNMYQYVDTQLFYR